MKNVFFLLLAALVAGCAAPKQLGPNEYIFSFESVPTGAMVYFGDGQAIAAAPYRSVFSVDPRSAARDVVAQKFLVVWPSGARLEETKYWRPKENREWRFTFSRPSNAPNLAADLQNARSVQERQAQPTRQEPREPVAGTLLQSLMDGYNARPSSITPSLLESPPRGVNCSARRTTMGPSTMNQQYEVDCR